MPKVTIEFNLPEEEEALLITNKALDMHSAIWEFYNYMRSNSRHGEHAKEVQSAIDEMYKEYCEVMKGFIE